MDRKERALLGFKFMARPRALMEVLILHRQDIFGAFLTGFGQEAVAAGIMLAMYEKGILLDSPKDGDHRMKWIMAPSVDEITAKNNHNHAFEIIKNHLCKATSASKGKDGNIHWGCLPCLILPFFCSSMGRLAGVLDGMAQEMARQPYWRKLPENKCPVGVTFFGEGADQQGAIHEKNVLQAAANCRRAEEEISRYEKFLDTLAKKSKLFYPIPAFQVVVENQFSIYTNIVDEHGNSDLAKRAFGYGNMQGFRRDGDDLDVMYDMGNIAIQNAQQFIATRIIAETYRRTGHNEDQIQRDPLMMRETFAEFSKGNFKYEPDWSRGKIMDVDPEEFKEQWSKEPIKRYYQKLISEGVATGEELTNIMVSAREEMWMLYEKAKKEPDVSVEDYRKDLSLFPPYPKWSMPQEVPKEVTSAKKMTYGEAYLYVLEELLRDDRVVVFGQDVATGGVLLATRKLREKFGPMKVFNMPITEEAIHSNAVGRALAGGRPIFEGQQFAPFFTDAAPSMWEVVSYNWFQKRAKFPFINIFHCGVVHAGGSGAYHEGMPEGFLQRMLGYTIVFPADAYDLVGLMRSSFEFDGPVAFMLQIAASQDPQFARDIPEEPYLIPLGKAKVKKEGKDITVIAYGASPVQAALNEAEFLEEEGISAEVIDLRTVWPLDKETLKESIFKTGNFIVMHENSEDGGIGDKIISDLISKKDGVFYYLHHYPRMVASYNVPSPTARELVWDRLPYIVERRERADGSREINVHRSPKLAREIKEMLGT